MSAGPLTVEPLATPPDATIEVPGSKSHTNRALVCAALAAGRSTLSGALFADDTTAMMSALSELGAGIEADPATATVSVEGCDGRWLAGPRQLDVALSGTTSRFVLALLGLGQGPYVLDGGEGLRARPFGPLVAALRRLGMMIDGDRLPLTVTGDGLHVGSVELSGSVSSQFLSGLLLAAPYAEPDGDDSQRPLTVELSDELVSKPYVDLTLSTMASFGVEATNDRYRRFTVVPQRYRARSLAIEPDASAASYFFAAAAVTGGRVRIPGLGPQTVQGDVGFVDLLAAMGAHVERGPDWIEVVGPHELRGIDVDLADMSDVAQTLAVVATFATTPTTVRGIGFIRKKETDRIAAVVDELVRLGIDARYEPDGFTINPGRPRPGRVATYDDHRMAMSFALLGLCHPGIALEDPECVSKTFPRYFAVLEQLRAP